MGEGQGVEGVMGRVVEALWPHQPFLPPVARPPSGASSCRRTTTGHFSKRRPTNCPRSIFTASERCRTRPAYVGELRTGTRSAKTREKRHRSGCGAFRETRSRPPGRSSRGSRVAHQPEDRCGAAIDRAILYPQRGRFTTGAIAIANWRRMPRPSPRQAMFSRRGFITAGLSALATNAAADVPVRPLRWTARSSRTGRNFFQSHAMRPQSRLFNRQ